MKKFNLILVVLFTQTSANKNSLKKEVKIQFYATEEGNREFDEEIAVEGNDENNATAVTDALTKLGIMVGKKMEAVRSSVEVKITSVRFNTSFHTSMNETLTHENHELDVKQMRVFHQGLHAGAWHKGKID